MSNSHKILDLTSSFSDELSIATLQGYSFYLDLTSLFHSPSNPPQSTFCLPQICSTKTDLEGPSQAFYDSSSLPFEKTDHSLLLEVLGLASRTRSFRTWPSASPFQRFVGLYCFLPRHLTVGELGVHLLPLLGSACIHLLDHLLGLITHITFWMLTTLKFIISGSPLPRLPVSAA